MDQGYEGSGGGVQLETKLEEKTKGWLVWTVETSVSSRFFSYYFPQFFMTSLPPQPKSYLPYPAHATEK